jgi:DNA repair protein RadA/Sms
VRLGQHDIYLSVAGGVKISEPAADLAAAAALVSSLTGAVLPQDMVFFGEVALSGAVRPSPHANLRLKEAAKLGFSRAVAPQGPQEADAGKNAGIVQRPVRHIGEAIADIAALGRGVSSAPNEGRSDPSRNAPRSAARPERVAG